jgi:transcriptional regulator with XRE-family HTH domain
MNIADNLPIAELPNPAERARLRILFGVSQSELAREIGVVRQMVNRYESGRSEPAGEHRTKYAEILSAWAATERRISGEIKTAGDSIPVADPGRCDHGFPLGFHCSVRS